MGKYVLFGAGKYGCMILEWLHSENVAYFVDNSIEKQNTVINGKKVYSLEEKKEDIKQYEIIISAKADRNSAMAADLRKVGIDSFYTYKEIEQEVVSKRLSAPLDIKKTYINAMDWIQKNSITQKGIINNTNLKFPYPEVSGYYIPTLIRWNNHDLAIQYAKWLCDIQKNDGSWWGTENDMPYVFDTAQIIKGLLAIRVFLPEVDENINRACEWLCTFITDEGRFKAYDDKIWGDGKIISELIHIYCLSPIRDAGVLFNKNEYVRKSESSLDYYIDNCSNKIKDFHLLSHFYAYVMEGLIDMGRDDVATEAMEALAAYQKDSGAVPAYKNVNWVCSTGLFQLALVWFRLGNQERGIKAFEYACKLQNESGGWYGSYLSENDSREDNTYFPDAEISWANKYFLDALYYRDKVQS